jgi:O-antigen/teichoic acid export membrane protein
MRWTDRLIGFASTLILARLLLPEDFGIIAMASLVVMLLDVMLDLGVHMALIQNQQADAEDYNTAWTIRLGQASAVALLVAAAAPLAAIYYSDPRVEPVLWVMALGMFIAGWENIGTVDFQKHMEFGRDFRFVFAKRITGFVVTIALAFALRSYWAMVMGALAGRFAGVGFSYAMHAFRPRFSLSRARAIFGVSQWILVKSLATWLSDNLHKLMVGRIASAPVMGAYALADDISAMPTNELLAPINRVMLPAFSRAKDNPAEMRRLFGMTQAMQAMIGLPAGVGLALIAPEAVPILLGDKWLAAIPFVQILAIANALTALHASGNYLLMSMGRFSWSAMLQWVQVLAFLLCMVTVWHDPQAAEMAGARLVTVLFATLLTLWLAVRAVSGLSLAQILSFVWRPLVATAAMGLAIRHLFAGSDWSMVSLMLAKIGFAVPLYIGLIALFWLASGRPDGAERWLLDQARRLPGLRPRVARGIRS